MKFVKIEGFKGKVFEPVRQGKNIKKHNCRDCFSCNFCDDERCKKCLYEKGHVGENDSPSTS